LLELLISFIKIGVRPFVFPGEIALLLNIGPTAITAAFAGAGLESQGHRGSRRAFRGHHPTQSMKCSWETLRSLRVSLRHLTTNSWGDMVVGIVTSTLGRWLLIGV
jgi:hypothetical protein